jgi:predicted DNA-binding transcriptional regulator AlpA
MQAAKDLGVARATFYRFIKNRMAGMPDPGRGATYIY